MNLKFSLALKNFGMDKDKRKKRLKEIQMDKKDNGTLSLDHANEYKKELW